MGALRLRHVCKQMRWIIALKHQHILYRMERLEGGRERCREREGWREGGRERDREREGGGGGQRGRERKKERE